MAKQQDDHRNGGPITTPASPASITDAQKERGAHVFLTAWKIWLEAQHRPNRSAQTSKAGLPERHG